MAVIRVEKNSNYTTMSNYHLRDKNLSLKAKGLLSEMLSLPDDWKYSVSGIVSKNKEKEDTIKSTLKELKDAGYLVVNKILPCKENGGVITYEYVVYEKPIDVLRQEGENQHLDSQHLDGQPIENPPLLNTNIINTNQLTTNLSLEKETKAKKESFDPVACLYKFEDIKDDSELVEAFKDFFEMRKALKKPLKTSKGVNGRVNECKRLAKNNHELMIKILNQSVEHEWLNLYELKKDSKQTSTNPYTEMLKEMGYTPEDILYGNGGDINFTG